MAKKQKYDKPKTQFGTCSVCGQVVKPVLLISNGKKKKVKMCGCN